jgi:hypothetical protein
MVLGRRVWLRVSRAEGLTYGGEDDHHEEGVEHGDDGGGERREHAAQLAQLAEEADDAEGAEEAQDGDGEVDGAQGEEGDEDDGGVEDVPAVPDEEGEPVGVEVDGELEEEDEGEGDVELVEGVLEPRVRVLREEAVVLRLDDVGCEVLQGRGSVGGRPWIALKRGRTHGDNEERCGALKHC